MLEKLINIVERAGALLALDGNDFCWSSWPNQTAALDEVDQILSELRAGSLDSLTRLQLLFAPTGPIQETSLGSGWAQPFVDLASEFDSVVESLKTR